VLELGQSIVRHLKLDARGNVLERWLAHHLAELMLKAANATGPEKEQAEREAVDLILKLWMHRRALPAPVDPLGGYREAIAVLGRLMPDGNPFRHYRHNHTYEGLLQEMFEDLTYAVVGGLLLTHTGHIRAFSEAESAFLAEEEVYLRTALDEWMEILPVKQSVDFIVFDPDAADSAEAQDQLSAAEFDNLTPEQQAAALESTAHAAIAEHLERVNDKLGYLLRRWRSAAPERVDLDEDAEEDAEEDD
jgi:hypothetical protein